MKNQISDEQNAAEEKFCQWAKELILMGVSRDQIISQLDAVHDETIRDQLNFDAVVEEKEPFHACSLQVGHFIELPNLDGVVQVIKVYQPYRDMIEIIGSDGLSRKFPLDFPLNNVS